MISYRKAIRFFSLVLTLGVPFAASAATFDVKTLVDVDHSRGTGCNVVTVGGIVSGIDVMITTTGTVTGATGTVTAVTRQTCVNPVLNLFSSPVAVDGGWNVGVSTAAATAGDVFVESHMGLDVLTMDNIGTPRFVFTTSSGLFSDALLTPWSWGGGDIIMPHAARDRSSAPLPQRNILLDGGNSDWAGNVPLANGTAAPPVWRFITASGYAGLHDLFFSFRIHTNIGAPTAHDDNYALSTLGGTLTVATLGVLNNDNPNNQPITASLVDTTQHGTLALAPDGGFTYIHDGSLASQDQFHYVAVGTSLISNLATVTIDLPGTHPYTFTSANNVTFIDGQPNSFLVTVTGKPTPELSVTGNLPAGITFQDNGNGTGVLSGTPAANTSGDYQLVFSADKNKPHQSSQNFTLTVTCPGVSVQNPAVTTGTAGTPFSQSFTQAGGTTPVSFSLNSGVLPPGLTLSAAGVLSGTPTASGTFPITVKVTDVGGCIGVGPTYNLVISCHPVTVNNPATATGTATAAFSQTFTQSGAISGATFSINSGTLPTGLTLSTAGVLSGTPTQTGSFPITVKVTDGQGCTGISATYTLVIGCQTITVTNPATNTGTAAAAFSQTFTAGNTIGAVTFTTASTLPTGLTLSSGGVLSGTPTQTGSFPIVVKATDANGCFGNGSTYALTIACQTITVNNPATNTGTVNIAFSQSFTAPAAIGTKTFSLNSGTLPTGLTLSAAGVLSGTPTQTGSFPITVHVVDGNGCSANGATYTLTIGCQIITVNNPATNSGTVNVAFSQSFTTTNSIGAVTFTTASTLPAGLALSPAGVLSGTPTQTGTFPIVVHAVDANGCSGNGASYSLTIGCQIITVNKPATTTGTVNAAFSQTFTSTNAIGTVTYSTASTLPTGLALSAAGVLSGTPTQSGSFGIVVHAVDANGCSGNSSTYTLVIGCQTITVTNPVTNSGTVNVAFSQTFTSSNTIGTVTYSTASPRPTGITLNSATGVLSGTPTQTGSFPIVVTATDANGCSGSGATYTLTIGCQTITVNNPATATGTVNAAFSQTFTASNTVGTLTFTTASSLPAGLSLSTAGVLSGTPTQTGSFPIVVHVADGNGCSANGATYTLVISCQTITVTNPATNTGTVSAPFTVTFTSGNTIGTVAYSTASTLPAGITLNSATGVLSGTPTQSGTFPIVVTATDANSCSGSGATYTLVIGCQVITVNNPATTSSPAGTPLSINFTQSGAIGTATFTTASTLPTGLTLDPDGTLHGTPTGNGPFPIAVTVTDSNNCTGTNAAYTLTLTCPTITVTNPGVSTGTAGVAFSQTFTQAGGQGTITWSETGALPAGITLNSASGVLSGTTNSVGSFPITVTATDGNGCTGSGALYTLTIGCQTINVTNPGVNTGTVDAAFSQTFTVSGILGTVTWSETGALPAGITLNSATGVLSGTPTVNGSFLITVKATDTNLCFGTSSYTLTINCQTITVTNPGTTTGTVDAAFSQTFTQSGAHSTASFTTASALPAGLSLSTAGVLSGTPTVKGTFPIVVTVTDSNGCTGTGATYTLVIGCQTITVTNPATTTGTAGVAFSQSFSQSGAHATASFTTASTLPTGFTLSNAGLLSGTTTQHGSFPIVVTVTDANGCTGTSATYTLVIACNAISVTNPATSSGTVSAAFSQTFTQSGSLGTPAFSTASTLPTGLTLHSATGVLDGTPTQSGTFPIVVTVTDSNGCTGTSATYTLIIACQTINVSNPATTSSPAGTPLSINFTQTGAIGTATFSTASTLPTGLTLAANGTLSGTPSGSGAFPIVVTVTDSNGCTGTNPAYTLTITCPAITVTNPGVSTGTAGVAFSQTFTQSGGQGTITWSKTGALPVGITLNSGSGVLSGTTNAAGSFPITVKATDSNGCFGTSSYTLTINCQTITVTNPGVNTGTVDAPFSQTFTVTGILGTVSWSETGALPSSTPGRVSALSVSGLAVVTGLTFNSATGVLSGTPTVTGTFPITVKATDTNGCFGTSAYTLTINCQTITVTKPGTTTGTVDAPFSQTFTQSGAHGTATFTTASALPAGLTLSSAGVLSGTPTVKGSFPIVVTVTDSNGCTGSATSYPLVISCQTITVTNPATTTGTAGTAFSQSFTQSGAHGTATFTTASALPSGFTLSNAGVLSGTTTQHGSFPIVVTVTDSNSCTGTSATYNLNIACNPISVTNPATTTGTVSAAFSQTFTQSGSLGTPAFTTASTLPTGLTLHSATGVLDGTPTQSGSFPIVVTVTDTNGCTGTSATYTLVIGCQVITVTNPGVNTGTAGVAFSQTFTQSAGIGTITWSETGTLPTGISLNTSTGALFGTTTQTGAFPITVKATDANGCFGTSAYTLTINCQTITVTNPATTTTQAGVAFDQAFTASGILGTATWSVTGTLPTGITINTSTGHLAGTTTQIGSYPITVTATDSNACSGTGATYTLTVTCPTIVVTRTGGGSFPAGIFNSAYTGQSVTATPASTYTFAVTLGSLPTGLSLSSAGAISGTPTATGSFTFTITATDSASLCTGSQSFSINIAPVAVGDSYPAASNIVDNTQFVITGGSTTPPATTPFVSSATSLIANDLPAVGTTATPGTFTTSAGGSVTIAADGTFIYTPKANPTAAAITSDSFTYTVVSNGITSAAATVNLTLANRVWYVKNNGAAGNGQSQNPFNTLAAAQAASLAGDIIYVYNGDGLTTGQNAGITLKNNQQLIGEGVALVVNTVTLKAAGTKPQITNTAGDGVTLNNGNTLKGFTVTGTSSNAINGTNTNGLTVDTVTATAAGAGASSLVLTTPSNNVTITNTTLSNSPLCLTINGGTANFVMNNTNTITANASQRSINFANLGATAFVNVGAAITDNGVGMAVSNSVNGAQINFTGTQTLGTTTNTAVTLTTNGATSVTSFSGTLAITTSTGSGFVGGAGILNVSGTANITSGAAAAGLNLNGTTIGGSGVTFNSINTTGATTGISLTGFTAANHVTVNGGTISGGTTGVSLSGANTSLTLAGVTLTGSTTAISGATFGTLTIGASVNVSGVTALNLATGAVSGTFANVTSSGGTNGVNLNAVTGTWGVTAGTLTGAAGATFNALGASAGALSWAGAITQANGANAVTISGGHTGTINFSGNVQTSSTSTGITISGSSGTYNFTGATNTIAGSGGGINIGNGATESGTITFGSGTSITSTAAGAVVNINGAVGTPVSANVTYSGTISKSGTSGLVLNIANYSGTLLMNGTSIVGLFNGNGSSTSTLSAITGSVTINNLSLTSGFNTFSGTLLGISGVNTGSTITFNHLVLSANGSGHTGAGLVDSGTGGTVTVTGTGGASTFDTGGAALSLSGQAMGASTIGTLTCTAGASAPNANCVSLTSVTGSLTISGGAITGGGGAAFLVNGGTATISDAGTITQNTAGQRSIDIQNKTGGTVAISGAVTDNGGGISLTSNGGATINFTGGLALSTGANPAFTATGGGTVNATQNNTTIVNTIATTSGTGINITSTNIGASNVTFRSISAGTGAGSGGDGIILDTTGGSGGLIVVGNGGTCNGVAANCTGGQIQHKTGADGGTTVGNGIYLNSTQKVSLTGMWLHDFDNDAVLGTSVTGFTLDNSWIDGVNGNQTNVDGSVIFTGLFGAGATKATISNSTIKGGWGDNVRVTNTTAPALDLTVTNCTIRDTNTATNGNDNINIAVHGTGDVTAHVTKSTFAATNGDHIQTICDETGKLTIVIGGTAANANTFSGGGGVNALGQGITISGGSAAPSDSTETVSFNVSFNTLTGTIQGGAINVNEGVGNGSWQGSVSNNTIGSTTTGSGTSQSSGIRVENHAKGTLTALVSSNVVKHWSSGAGINFSAGDTGATGLQSGPLNITFTSNAVSNGDGFSDHGMQVNAGTQIGNNNQVCFDAKSNNLAGNVSQGGVDYRLRQRMLTTVALPGYGGTQFDNTAVNAYILARPNTASGSGTVATANAGAGGGYTNAGAQCAQATVPP
jgi:hypothetical protein